MTGTGDYSKCSGPGDTGNELGQGSVSQAGKGAAALMSCQGRGSHSILPSALSQFTQVAQWQKTLLVCMRVQVPPSIAPPATPPKSSDITWQKGYSDSYQRQHITRRCSMTTHEKMKGKKNLNFFILSKYKSNSTLQSKTETKGRGKHCQTSDKELTSRI